MSSWQADLEPLAPALPELSEDLGLFDMEVTQTFDFESDRDNQVLTEEDSQTVKLEGSQTPEQGHVEGSV